MPASLEHKERMLKHLEMQSKQPTPKLCRDCKWSHQGLLDRLIAGAQFAKCLHESALRADVDQLHSHVLVTGRLQALSLDDYGFASVNRLHACGADGKHWVPR